MAKGGSRGGRVPAAPSPKEYPPLPPQPRQPPPPIPGPRPRRHVDVPPFPKRGR
jgi:hypothetical protein